MRDERGRADAPARTGPGSARGRSAPWAANGVRLEMSWFGILRRKTALMRPALSRRLPMRRCTLLAFLSLAASSTLAAASPPLPTAARRAVADTYWGATVVDDYRWLEHWKDP